MRLIKHALFYLLVIVSMSSCSSNDTDDNPNNSLDTSIAYELSNVSYGTDNSQNYDVYLPANRTASTKTIVLIHGGGWTSGDKADMIAFYNYIKLSLPQVAIVNMNYRLADENNSPYPMQLDDISQLMSHLTEKQSEYTISNDFGMMGVSAGGHLSLLWSYDFDTNNQISMVCSIVGPTNLADPAYTGSTNPVIQEIMSSYGDNLTNAFLELVSPLHQVTANAPPTILFYGGQDPLVPSNQGPDLRDKLQQLGVTHELTLYENEGHTWEGANLIDTANKLKAFIETHLLN